MPLISVPIVGLVGASEKRVYGLAPAQEAHRNARSGWRMPDPALVTYFLGQGLRSVIRSALEDIPAQLESPALLDSLVVMALGCLRPAQSDGLSESSPHKSGE